MTTTLAPAPVQAMDKTEAILQPFQAAGHPLTVKQANNLYKGPKLSAKELARTIEDELVMQGRLFRCSPSGKAGKTARYWVNDEDEQVRASVERQLGKEPLAESKLATAVNKDLPKVSSPAAIKRIIQAMHQEGKLHERPGTGRTHLLTLQPFDPTELISFKKGTLTDLSGVVAKMQRFGVNLDRVLQILRERLSPRRESSTPQAVASPPHGEVPTAQEKYASPEAEIEELILKGMRDLEPAVRSGASVLLRDLRRHMPAEYQRHETFDAAVIRLANQEQVVLNRHDHPMSLSEAERDELVREGSETYFTSIAHRV